MKVIKNNLQSIDLFDIGIYWNLALKPVQLFIEDLSLENEHLKTWVLHWNSEFWIQKISKICNEPSFMRVFEEKRLSGQLMLLKEYGHLLSEEAFDDVTKRIR